MLLHPFKHHAVFPHFNILMPFVFVAFPELEVIVPNLLRAFCLVLKQIGGQVNPFPGLDFNGYIRIGYPGMVACLFTCISRLEGADIAIRYSFHQSVKTAGSSASGSLTVTVIRAFSVRQNAGSFRF